MWYSGGQGTFHILDDILYSADNSYFLPFTIPCSAECVGVRVPDMSAIIQIS